MTGVFKSVLLSGALMAGPVLAEGPPEGCYVRDYTDAHLAGQPAQVVDWMQLWIYSDENQNKLANMLVGFTNQGHVAGTQHAGQVLDQFLLCFDSGGRKGCTVECDGGNFFVTRDSGDAMTIETSYLMVGETDSCGGAVDLAEVPGKAVKYKLFRADAQRCEAARTVYVVSDATVFDGPSGDGESK
ncbi:hypothetical protein [Shimia sp.]|jgi:hypothetical protein|uniref:hypothetical protein n=1 Tax=unclassified Shimia TaxID=2630038 RepID=UPI0025FDE73F|nr:hypothetical protein [Shimia sp.]MCH2066371.1 hypothetical protein [Shimia sp.]